MTTSISLLISATFEHFTQNLSIFGPYHCELIMHFVCTLKAGKQYLSKKFGEITKEMRNKEIQRNLHCATQLKQYFEEWKIVYEVFKTRNFGR